MIEGIILKNLVVHRDERGALFEILRSDEKIFRKFGQAYITICKPGWVKGWHYHKIQEDNFCVIKGEAKIVLVSPDKKKFQEFELSAEEPALLKIPPLVIHGFECLSKNECWILNIPTLAYNHSKPDEYRLPLNSEEVPYQPWKKRKGW